MTPTLRLNAKKQTPFMQLFEMPAHQPIDKCANHLESQHPNSLYSCCRNNTFARQEKRYCWQERPKVVHSLINLRVLGFLFSKSPECMKLCISQCVQKKSTFFLIKCINLHQLECTVSYCKAHVTKFALMSVLFYWFY